MAACCQGYKVYEYFTNFYIHIFLRLFSHCLPFYPVYACLLVYFVFGVMRKNLVEIDN